MLSRCLREGCCRFSTWLKTKLVFKLHVLGVPMPPFGICAFWNLLGRKNDSKDDNADASRANSSNNVDESTAPSDASDDNEALPVDAAPEDASCAKRAKTESATATTSPCRGREVPAQCLGKLPISKAPPISWAKATGEQKEFKDIDETWQPGRRTQASGQHELSNGHFSRMVSNQCSCGEWFLPAWVAHDMDFDGYLHSRYTCRWVPVEERDAIRLHPDAYLHRRLETDRIEWE